MPRYLFSSSLVLWLISCGGDDGDSSGSASLSSTVGSSSPSESGPPSDDTSATTDPSDDEDADDEDADDEDADDEDADDEDADDEDADGGAAIECTFPDDPSICGCGNACVGDPGDDDYGTCRTCIGGSGCVSEDIWCCSDADCPGSMLCTTVDSDPDVGYHICLFASDLDPCESDYDCYEGEICLGSRCRDG